MVVTICLRRFEAGVNIIMIMLYHLLLKNLFGQTVSCGEIFWSAGCANPPFGIIIIMVMMIMLIIMVMMVMIMMDIMVHR